MNAYIEEVKGKELQKLKPYIEHMEQIFADIGFREQIIGETKFFVFNNSYCKITPLIFPNGEIKFVLEWADSREEAASNLLEDGELYSETLLESERLDKLRKDLLKQIKSL